MGWDSLGVTQKGSKGWRLYMGIGGFPFGAARRATPANPLQQVCIGHWDIEGLSILGHTRLLIGSQLGQILYTS